MSRKILIVGDSKFMRTSIRKILERNSLVVIGEADTREEAIEKYIELKPDIVTMDITMPVLDGIQAVKAIKNINSTAKIIMCSAIGQSFLIMDAIKAGASDFIVKPFQENMVIKSIKNIC